MKQAGSTDMQIAKRVDRPYWGLVDKIRRLRAESRL